MTTAELIYATVKQLPENKQAEVLDFAEFVRQKAAADSRSEDAEWSDFSIASAMQGMEDEEAVYSLDDIKEKLQ